MKHILRNFCFLARKTLLIGVCESAPWTFSITDGITLKSGFADVAGNSELVQSDGSQRKF